MKTPNRLYQFRISNTVKAVSLMVLGGTALSLTAFCSIAVAQTQSWDLAPRAKAENANSRALNFLELEKDKHNPKSKTALDDAIALLLTATQADPNDPLPWSTLGLALNMKGRYGEALDALTTSYKLDKRRAETLLSIGITQMLSHHYDQAIDAFGRFVRAEPTNCNAIATLGFAYQRKGELDKAEGCFRKAIGCRANSEVAYHGLALTRYLQGQLGSALEAANHAQSIERYEPVTVLQAELNFLSGNTGAMNGLLQAAAKESSNGTPLKQRSMTSLGYIKQHDFHFDPYLFDDLNDANLIGLRALDLPKSASRQKSLVHSKRTQTQIERAEQLLAAAPDDFFVLHQVALLNLAVGNYDEAITQFTKVLTDSPSAHVDLLYLARALELNGRKTEAAGAIRAYRKDHPDEKLANIFTMVERSVPAPEEAPPVVPQKKEKPQEVPSAGF